MNCSVPGELILKNRLAVFFLVVVGTITGLTCSSGGPAPCTKETDEAYCMRLAKNCDVVTGFDNCGSGRSVNCGTCTAPNTCGGSGTPNLCGAGSAGGGSAGGGSAGGGAGGGDVDAGCLIACPTHTHYFKGTFTIDMNYSMVNGTPYTHAFDGVVNEPISFVASLEINGQTQMAGSGPIMPNELVLTGGPTDFFFSGDTSGVMANLKAEWENHPPPTFYLATSTTTGAPATSFFTASSPMVTGQPMYTLELDFTPTGVMVGSTHYAEVSPFADMTAIIDLRRFSSTGTFTDFATGTAHIRFDTP
jgi:hypothetical protein